jgi:phage terminase large subunit-like protein
MKLRAQILSGEGIDSGWAEWSIPDMTEDIFNVSLWYETNPSMGTILTERKIRAEIRGDSVDFNIQRLGLWLKYNQKSAISELEWTELKADSLPVLSGKRFLGIKFGHDGTNVSMSIAIRTDDGRIFVEAIDCRPIRAGNLWMMDYLKNPHVQAVVIDGDNGKQLLKDEMREEHLPAPVLITTKEVIAAGAMFEQALFMKKICHMGQPSLTQSVSNCEKRPIGSNGGFGYKSLNDQIDVSLLESVVLAHWLCATTKEQKKQRVSY